MCGHRRRGRLSIAVAACACLLATITPLASTADVSAEEFASVPKAPVAPTALGAPFLPAPDRSDALSERAALLDAADELSAARAALRWRDGAEQTSRILEAQAAAIDRSLSQLSLDQFASATSHFGIDAGVFPVAELRKPFRNDWHEPRSGGRLHKGTDLLAQIGVPLLAIEDGRYEQTTVGSLGGLSVYLVGDSGARYYYAHLDEAVAMEPGERVYAGQVIGTVGDSGNARGSPHLHLQWAPDGDSGWENPYPLLAALYGEGAKVDPHAYGPPIRLG